MNPTRVDPVDGSMSMAEYSRHRGVSKEAVRKAIAVGRLDRSLDRSGRHPRIVSAELADREWTSSTDLTRAPGSVQRAALGRGDVVSEFDFAAENAREKHWKANIAELDYQTRRGELVPVADVEEKFVEAVTAAKTKLLGLSKRIAQRLPHVSRADIDLIHELVREALEDLAHGD